MRMRPFFVSVKACLLADILRGVPDTARRTCRGQARSYTASCREDDGIGPEFSVWPEKTKPHLLSQMGFWNLILTMTYSHMGKPHTTIGDASFHC